MNENILREIKFGERTIVGILIHRVDNLFPDPGNDWIDGLFFYVRQAFHESRYTFVLGIHKSMVLAYTKAIKECKHSNEFHTMREYNREMKLFPKNLFIQNLDAAILRENFLVAAIFSIFFIRVFLQVSGYPQLGGGGLHIAHMLWGGLFMLVAFIINFYFLSKASANFASILAGVGFGTFIDELGKFITRDNDYFFQPTIALIYAIFVLIYVFSKGLVKYNKVSKEEYLVNALELMKDAVINDLDQEEKKQVLAYLKKSDQRDPMVQALSHFIQEVETIAPPPPSLLSRLRHHVTVVYTYLAKSRLILRSLAVFLLLQTAGMMFFTGLVIFNGESLYFDEQGRFLSSLIAGIFVLLGLILYRFSRERAFRLFKASILTSLLLTQFFLFYEYELLALLGVGFNMLLLLVVDYALTKGERETTLSA